MGLFAALLVDIGASWARLFLALFISIIFSLVVGIVAATDSRLERVILPAIDILQTIPILGFFPVVIYLIVAFAPGTIGVNLAVVFLIFTSMAWNITFGVYESVKSIPTDLLEVARLSQFSKWKMYTRLYVPACMPRIAYQSVISWSVGLFYLVTSEIFATGTTKYSVTSGIGVAISSFAASSNTSGYVAALAMFIVAVIVTRILFLQPLSVFSDKYSFKEKPSEQRKSSVLSFYSSVAFQAKKILGPLDRLFSRPRKELEKVGAYMISDNKVSRYMMSRAERFRLSRNLGIAIILALLLVGILATIKIGFWQYMPEVLNALMFSFLRVWLIFLFCTAVAVPLGIYIGLKTRAFEPIMSFLQVISAIPSTILLPALVVVFYTLPFGGEVTAFFVIFLAMFWYILFSVIGGIRGMPGYVAELRPMLKLNRREAWTKLYLPSILPSYITGAITAIGGAWNALIVAEYFTVQSHGNSVPLTQVGTGIGKLLDVAVANGQLELMLAALVAMVAMVVLINRFVWQNLYNKVTSKYRFSA